MDEIRTLADVEREHIIKVFELNSRDREKTAKDLGICLKTLYSRLQSYGVLPPLKQHERTKRIRAGRAVMEKLAS